MSSDFPPTNRGLMITAEIVAILFESDTSLQRYNFQTMAAEIKGLIDFWPEQATDIGTIGIFPTLVYFPANRCPAYMVILFKDYYIES
jgi:hypothetical protein